MHAPVLPRMIAATLAAAAALRAAASDCPEPQTPIGLPAPAPQRDSTPIEDQEIHFEADSMEATRNGEFLLKGAVTIQQGDRRLKTRDAVYNDTTQSFKVDEPVEYSDPELTVSGDSARLEPGGGATFEGAQFALPGRGARGSAARIRATTQGELDMRDVRYTTCPIGNEDWVLRASNIDIRQRAGFGVGRGVRLDFKGVPILYAPIISFPVGNERKSGFLFPTFGTSSRSGTSLAVPWYWNIAPNYDATFTPTYFSKRGAKLDSELRYLSSFGRGLLDAQYLPDDDEFGAERSLMHFVDRSDFTERLRLDLDAANASDSNWFEDFGLGPEGTSVSFLNRSASLTYLSENWLGILRAQNFQTIDDVGIAPEDRPHTLLPQLALRARSPQSLSRLTLGFDMEAAGFAHNYDDRVDTGWRLDAAPELRLPMRAAGMYLEPSASWRYTSYKLDDAAPGSDRTPTRAAPVISVDGGLIFERPSGSRQQRVQTLEPRFMYSYVPFRDQSALPVFDTGAADLNLVQLFRTNRYVGADRLSDANQVSFGLTSRLLDGENGNQFISATIGQAYYFDEPRVALPGEVLEDPEFSDIIAELDLTAYQDWNISMGVQWDPGETRSEKGDVQIQYRPRHDQVMNVGYRFRRSGIEQVDGSVAWPLGNDWSAYGRLVYSLEDESTLDQFAGLEYRSCCWRIRLVARRYVSDRSGDRDTSFLLQLELKGLSSVGVGADAFLERSIRGYSLRPDDSDP